MDFASQYEFKHTTSSPYHSQGKGRAEAAVKVSESMLKKSDDFQSPCSTIETHHQKATPTLLPNAWLAVGHEQHSRNHDTVSGDIKAKRNASKVHYDKTAGPEHNIINIGEFVYVRPPTSKSGNPWAYGRVTKNATKDHTPCKRHAHT